MRTSTKLGLSVVALATLLAACAGDKPPPPQMAGSPPPAQPGPWGPGPNDPSSASPATARPPLEDPNPPPRTALDSPGRDTSNDPLADKPSSYGATPPQ